MTYCQLIVNNVFTICICIYFSIDNFTLLFLMFNRVHALTNTFMIITRCLKIKFSGVIIKEYKNTKNFKPL